MRHHDYKEFYVLTNLMHVNCAYVDLLLPVLFMLVITANFLLYFLSVLKLSHSILLQYNIFVLQYSRLIPKWYCFCLSIVFFPV